MTKRIALVTAVALLTLGSTAYALYSVEDTGQWPKSWPQELEPLRKQSRTFVGPLLSFRHFAISFDNREEFEAAWPHLLKVKSRGAPIFFVSSPNFFLEKKKAGAVIHCPPERQWDNPNTPEAPIENTADPHPRWQYTNYIELVVDGSIVDLNRIPLPPDTPIIDKRFADGAEQTPTTEPATKKGR